jgi:choline-glycine betaine transporter
VYVYHTTNHVRAPYTYCDVILYNICVYHTTGHHLHDLLDLSFQTDAFEQLNMDIDGKSGPKVWMDWWTVFYWGWWVSWSPFVGIFMARISVGRTIGQVINASITGPVLWTFLWFGIFGGAGLRYERAAILDGCLGQCQTVVSGSPFDAKYCRSSVSNTKTWQGQADFDLQEKVWCARM